MVGHYGSTQLRTTGRAAVLAAADGVCRERGIKCLLGPALNGWVGESRRLRGRTTPSESNSSSA